MSVQAQSWVIANSRHKGSELLLLLMIANHAHADGTNAFPSLTVLAEECRISRRQIVRLLKTLEASGELVIHRNGTKTNCYSIRMEAGRPPASGGSEPGQDVRGTPDKMSPPASDKMSPPASDKMSPPASDKMSPELVTNSASASDTAMSFPPTPPYKDNNLNRLEHKPRVRTHARGVSAKDFGPPLYQPEKIGGRTLAEFTELLDAAAPHLAGEHPAYVRKMWRSGTEPLEVVKCYNAMRMEAWRTSRITWKTVAGYLPDWKFRKEKGIEPGKENANYGKPKRIRTLEDLAASREAWRRKYGLAADGRSGDGDQSDQQDEALTRLLNA